MKRTLLWKRARRGKGWWVMYNDDPNIMCVVGSTLNLPTAEFKRQYRDAVVKQVISSIN